MIHIHMTTEDRYQVFWPDGTLMGYVTRTTTGEWLVERREATAAYPLLDEAFEDFFEYAG